MSGSVIAVEDDPELLQMLRDFLAMDGYQVVGISRPQMVREVATTVHPDMFIIDVMLPGMSGIELASDLQAGGFAQTPMIAMSASALMREVASRSGLFAATMAKPFELDSLEACMKQAVGGSTSSAMWSSA